MDCPASVRGSSSERYEIRGRTRLQNHPSQVPDRHPSRGRATAAAVLCCCLACVASACREGASGSRGAGGTRIAGATPVLDIAGSTPSGEFVFAHAAGATRLSTGSIVMADGIENAVLFFDSSGRKVRGVGRRGRGPGEFAQIAWLGQCGPDSVVVWDRMLGRFTVIDSTGNVIRQYRPADPDPAIIACSRGGTYATLATPDMPAVATQTGESPHYRAPLALLDARGAIVRQLGLAPVGESRPLGKLTQIAVSADRLYMGTQDSAWIDVLSLDGRLLLTLPVGGARRRVTLKHYEHTADALVASYSDANERKAMREWVLKTPMPEYLPPYGPLVVDPDGRLWVQLSFPGDSETVLRAVSNGGSVLAEVHLPLDLRVFEVGRDYVIGAYEEEETGEPHLALYRLASRQ